MPQKKAFLEFLAHEFKDAFNIQLNAGTFSRFYDQVKRLNDRKRVFIIDEVEGLNSHIFGQFLHTIRNLYHFREQHSFKKVIGHKIIPWGKPISTTRVPGQYFQ